MKTFLMMVCPPNSRYSRKADPHPSAIQPKHFNQFAIDCHHEWLSCSWASIKIEDTCGRFIVGSTSCSLRTATISDSTEIWSKTPCWLSWSALMKFSRFVDMNSGLLKNSLCGAEMARKVELLTSHCRDFVFDVFRVDRFLQFRVSIYL